MTERLTKSATRNIFYGVSAFFLVVFRRATLQTQFHMTGRARPTRR